jgi:hypothetical protein
VNNEGGAPEALESIVGMLWSMSGDISWEGLVEKKYSSLSFPWSREKTAVRGGITPIARGVEDFSTRPKASPGKSNSMVLTDTPEAAKREKR